jgi:hypothetical protein
MKSIEQLKKLEQNPFYTLTEAEKQYLQGQKYTGLPADPEAELDGTVSTATDTSKKKQQPNALTKKNVAAKEIGTVEKHPSDPAVE